MTPDSRPYSSCFSTLGCTDLRLDEVLSLAAEHAIDCVELRGLGGTLDLCEYFGEAQLDARALQERHGVNVRSLSASLRLVEADDEQKADFLRLAELAEALGVGHIRAFDGGTLGGDTSEQVEAALRTADWFESHRERSGWSLRMLVETHWSLADTTACEAFAGRMPGTCALLWDASHTYYATGEPLEETWGRLREWIGHVHIKDSVATDDGHRYVLPGRGELPIVGLLGRLADDGFSGAVSLEWERHWHPELPPLGEALAAARDAGWF